ncbi:MAG TPA: hypothetical protein VK768_03680 [Chthoniobacterales bacterium]|nr:hypothetical protein [Chthoniobacterales bacterium]
MEKYCTPIFALESQRCRAGRGVHRSPFTVHRFGVRRSALGVRRSAFGGGQVYQQSQVPHSEEFKQDALLTHPVSKPSRLLQATAERRAVNGERIFLDE